MTRPEGYEFQKNGVGQWKFLTPIARSGCGTRYFISGLYSTEEKCVADAIAHAESRKPKPQDVWVKA